MQHIIREAGSRSCGNWQTMGIEVSCTSNISKWMLDVFKTVFTTMSTVLSSACSHFVTCIVKTIFWATRLICMKPNDNLLVSCRRCCYDNVFSPNIESALLTFNWLLNIYLVADSSNGRSQLERLWYKSVHCQINNLWLEPVECSRFHLDAEHFDVLWKYKVSFSNGYNIVP